MNSDTDPCATCKLGDVLDGDNPTAHWRTPTSNIITAWTCSDECATKLEATRTPEGLLE